MKYITTSKIPLTQGVLGWKQSSQINIYSHKTEKIEAEKEKKNISLCSKW